MERISRNYHARLQEMCDCYMETDYRKEIEVMASQSSDDVGEDALKYLALSILYATTEKAKKLSFKKKKGEPKVVVKAEEKMELPTPPGKIADKIFEIMRSITSPEPLRLLCSHHLSSLFSADYLANIIRMNFQFKYSCSFTDNILDLHIFRMVDQFFDD